MEGLPQLINVAQQYHVRMTKMCIQYILIYALIRQYWLVACRNRSTCLLVTCVQAATAFGIQTLLALLFDTTP